MTTCIDGLSTDPRGRGVTFAMWANTSLFNIVPYLRVPIVLRPSHSLLLGYTSKLLYDKNMNNDQ